jgi:hypothetical protein
MQKPIELHCLADRIGDDSHFFVGQLNAGHRSPGEARLQQGAAIGKISRPHVIGRRGLKIQFPSPIFSRLAGGCDVGDPLLCCRSAARKRLCERLMPTPRGAAVARAAARNLHRVLTRN